MFILSKPSSKEFKKLNNHKMLLLHLFSAFVTSVKRTLLLALFTCLRRAPFLLGVCAALTFVSDESSYDVAIFTGSWLKWIPK